MSHAPLLGAPSANCVMRSATDSCSKSGLPSVIGCDSSAVGPADAVNGVKSENRVPSAKGTATATNTPPRVATMAHTRDVFIFTISIPANQVCVACPARSQAVANEREQEVIRAVCYDRPSLA